MKMTWTDPSVSSVSAKLRVRMPSWLSNPLTVSINGQPYGMGAPGSYLGIDRHWEQNDNVSFTLPIEYKLSLYTGVDQIQGYEGKRYALSMGPVVFACVGPVDKSGA